MKNLIILSFCFALISCGTKQQHKNAPQFSTVENLANHIDEIVTLKGKIVHVCSADGRKMKLVLSDGEVITVLPKKQGELFSKTDWQSETIKVTGKLSSRTITKNEFDTVFAQQRILCHIDLTPCIDADWVDNQWENGNAENVIAAQQEKLYKQMNEKSTDYIQQFSIVADELKKISF